MFGYLALAVMLGALVLTHMCFVTNLTYEHYWWAGVLMHLLGGVWVAFAVLLARPRTSWVFVVAGALIVGGVWEYLEFSFDTPLLGVGKVNFNDALWQLDTLIDLCTDAAGAFLLWALVSRYNKK